jgi:hypothetical protein
MDSTSLEIFLAVKPPTAVGLLIQAAVPTATASFCVLS